MFDWKEFLKLARVLNDTGGNDQSKLRTAISRTYYCVYHIAKDFLGEEVVEEAQEILNTESHNCVWKPYKATTVELSKEVGQLGLDLKRLRVEADYENNKVYNNKNVQSAINLANQIMTKLKEIEEQKITLDIDFDQLKSKK